MQILIKVIVTAVAGGLAYLLTGLAGQPKIWQLTMSIFVAGVVAVVQLLIDSAASARRLTETTGRISAAATRPAGAEGQLGPGLTRLVEAAGRLDQRESLQLSFVSNQVAGLAALIEGLRSGRAAHEGEDPDWLLGLTETATIGIDATSMTSFDRHRGFVDEGEFWASDLGLRYLDRQRRAIERGVRIRRLFLLTEDPTDRDRLNQLLEPHEKIGVQTRLLRPEDVDFLHQNDLEDFILFDQRISYEFHPARALRKDLTPLIAGVVLVVEPRQVKRRQERFEELWSAAGQGDTRGR